MRKATILSIALFILSTTAVLIGCDKSKPANDGGVTVKPATPSVEVKTKNSKEKLVKETLDDLPQPVRKQ